MGEIYSKARCTVVWLGPRGHDAELLEYMYSRLSILQSNTQESGGVLMLDHDILARIIGTSHEEEKHNKMVQRRRLLLEKFLDLPWFRRAWVYQEAVVALRVDMVWETLSFLSTLSLVWWSQPTALERARKMGDGIRESRRPEASRQSGLSTTTEKPTKGEN